VFFSDTLNFSFWQPEEGRHYEVTYKGEAISTPEADFFVVHQKMRISEDAHDEDKHLEDGKQHVLKDFLPSSSFNVNIDTYGTYLFDSAP